MALDADLWWAWRGRRAVLLAPRIPATNLVSQEKPNALEKSASGPWTDLGLTLPIFVGYHLGVVFLPVRNAADWVTRELVSLADNDLTLYGGLTLAIALVYVGILVVAGRGKVFRWQSFAMLMGESVLYAVAMKTLASYAIVELFLGPPGATSQWSGLILSFGAGFYEEVAFRVILFGMGLKAIKILFPLSGWQKPLVFLSWAVLSASFFSLWHYIGPLAEPLDAKSFVFRWVCGLVFTVIYAFRGFAPAVWTHALYDVWVMAL